MSLTYEMKVFYAAMEGRLEDLKGLLDHLPQWEETVIVVRQVSYVNPPDGELLGWAPGGGGVPC